MEFLSTIDVRRRLGEIWGLERELTRAELARALAMSEKYGGRTISRLERDGEKLEGIYQVAMHLMLDGGVPRTMENVIKPGYPRLRSAE
jgi:hypothetical protein